MNEQVFPCTEKQAEAGNCLNVNAILEGTRATSHFRLEDCIAVVIRNQYSAIFPKLSSTELLELLPRQIFFFAQREYYCVGNEYESGFFPLVTQKK